MCSRPGLKFDLFEEKIHKAAELVAKINVTGLIYRIRLVKNGVMEIAVPPFSFKMASYAQDIVNRLCLP